MKIPIIKFQFTTPLHISNSKADYESSKTIIHSDTLYSAILFAWGALGIPIEKNYKPSFAISSLFPYTKSSLGKDTFFFPKPYSQLNYETSTTGKIDSKKIKRVEYFDEYYFRALLENRKISNLGTDNQHIQGKYLSNDDIDKDFMGNQIIPRIKGRRFGTGDPEIFYTERIQFKENSGLYCLFICEDENTENLVSIALEYLSEEGLGTDRHVGNGFFEFTFKEESITFPQIPNTQHYTNLSLFSPEGDDSSHLDTFLDLDENGRNAFEVIKRGGWITKDDMLHLKKLPIYMFKEGSIFKSNVVSSEINSINVGGETVDVTPPIVKNSNSHSIYRIGKSIFLPIKL